MGVGSILTIPLQLFETVIFQGIGSIRGCYPAHHHLQCEYI